MKGRCVICGAVGKLTHDHVPPRGVAVPRTLEVRGLLERFEASPPLPRPRFAFQSVKFPSLCRRCNVDLLGSCYDPELTAFANRLSVRLRAVLDLGIWLPGDIQLDVRPHALARAVIGHLLAAEHRRDRNAPLTRSPMLDSMRRYFLDPSETWPPGLNLSFWPYLAEDQVIVRAFSIAAVLNPTYSPVVGDLLKFHPVAFWLTLADPACTGRHFTRLPLASTKGEESVTISVRPDNRPPARWPELPGEREVIGLSGERTSVATPPN